MGRYGKIIFKCKSAINMCVEFILAFPVLFTIRVRRENWRTPAWQNSSDGQSISMGTTMADLSTTCPPLRVIHTEKL